MHRDEAPRHNEGTIYERRYVNQDSARVIRFVAQLPINEQGKRPSLGSFRTRAEARQALQAAAVARAQGTLVLGKPPTVREWCEKWLAGRTQIAYNTRRNYTHSYKGMLSYIGHIRLDTLTEADIAEMWAKLNRGEGADGSPRTPLAFTTLGRFYTYLNAALRAAIRSRNIPLTYNPADSEEARPARGERQPINPLAEQEVQKLFEVTRDDREHPLWVTLITTGIRHSEAQALRWQDIDFDRKKVSVRGCLHREAGKGWVAGPTKTRRERMVDLRPHTIAALRTHRARQAEMRLRAGSLWVGHGLIFTTDTGTALDQRYIQRKFDEACARAGVARRKVKETRHTFATLGLARNVPVKIISEALGHSTTAITQDIYSHVIVGLQEDALSHLDRLFV